MCRVKQTARSYESSSSTKRFRDELHSRPETLVTTTESSKMIQRLVVREERRRIAAEIQTSMDKATKKAEIEEKKRVDEESKLEYKYSGNTVAITRIMMCNPALLKCSMCNISPTSGVISQIYYNTIHSLGLDLYRNPIDDFVCCSKCTEHNFKC
jgi:hypothetical protein